MALAIISIVFAAIVPLLRQIRDGWDSKQASSEAVQNGRVLMDHLSRNLSAAVKITAVSGPNETNGYVEFEDNDGNTLRYDIASSYVEYGVVGDLSDLAGPVSQLQFTCYDVCDLNTPITEVNDIRSVKVQTTLTNSFALGQDKTFIGQAYLRTNGNNPSNVITKETPFEYDSSQGATPALAQIDSTHYLCAYSGPGDVGWAVVLTADTNTWDITKGTTFEYDSDSGGTPTLAQIDSTHYLCAYAGPGQDGWAVVLTVDTGTWTITKETPFEYDTATGKTPALTQIDSTHYLCAYTGPGNDGWAVVLTVDTGTWDITKGTPFEYDSGNGDTPALAQIDSTHYLCTYKGPNNDGWAVVLTVDTGTWTITKETPFEYDTATGKTPALAKIDNTHYLCTYAASGNAGWAVVLTVDTGTWAITKETPFEYDATAGKTPALAQIDNSRYLCAYTGDEEDGWAVVLTVDTGTWGITKGTAFEYDSDNADTPALAQIDSSHYLCAYTDVVLDGWAVVLGVTLGSGIRP